MMSQVTDSTSVISVSVNAPHAASTVRQEALVVDEMLRIGFKALYGEPEGSGGVDGELAAMYRQMAGQTGRLEALNKAQQSLNTVLENMRNGMASVTNPRTPRGREVIGKDGGAPARLVELVQKTTLTPAEREEMIVLLEERAQAYQEQGQRAGESGRGDNLAIAAQYAGYAACLRLDALREQFPGLGIPSPASNANSISALETIQKNISAEQSTQGTVNEELTLKLNQKASERSAIFTQLQALLQTMAQLRASLSRW
jgi:hypothetical protein